MADPLDLRTPREFETNSEQAQYFDRINRILTGLRGVDLLGQTIGNPPTQTEVQDLSDRVDLILTKLQGL